MMPVTRDCLNEMIFWEANPTPYRGEERNSVARSSHNWVREDMALPMLRLACCLASVLAPKCWTKGTSRMPRMNRARSTRKSILGACLKYMKKTYPTPIRVATKAEREAESRMEPRHATIRPRRSLVSFLPESRFSRWRTVR